MKVMIGQILLDIMQEFRGIFSSCVVWAILINKRDKILYREMSTCRAELSSMCFLVCIQTNANLLPFVSKPLKKIPVWNIFHD